MVDAITIYRIVVPCALTPAEISAIDAAHVWHPYSTIGAEALPPVVAVGARVRG